MAKKEQKISEEQLDLIDVHPENEKEIVAAAKLYRKHLANRQAAGRKEVEQKEKILMLIKEAKLQPLEDGKIRFSSDGFTFTVTPRDFLVQITERTEE